VIQEIEAVMGEKTYSKTKTNYARPVAPEKFVQLSFDAARLMDSLIFSSERQQIG
jgi:hypothetical protein